MRVVVESQIEIDGDIVGNSSAEFGPGRFKGDLNKGKDYLIARITEITTKGVVTVKFSEEMLIPVNYTKFDDYHLDLWVKDHTFNEIESWEVIDFKPRRMYLQVNFVKSLNISYT